MTHRGFTSIVALSISAAICLQPRVASAVADMDDLATWLSQINGQLQVLNDEFADYSDTFLGEQYQSAWFRGTMQRREAFQDSVETTLRRALYEQAWTPRAAGRTNGMVRGLWNVDKGLSGLAGVFTNRESYYLDPDMTKDGFVFWDYKYGDADYVTPSFVEFLSLTHGQEFDPGVFWDGTDFETSFQNAFGGTNGPSHNPIGADDGSQFAFWVPWQAEAWRRQLAFFNTVPVSNLVGWVDSEIPATNELNSFMADSVSTNKEDEASFNGSLQRYGAVELITNRVSWFGPSGSSGGTPELVADIDWSIEGQANEVRIFGFDALNPGYSGILVVDFSQEPFSTMHTVCSWLVTVTTAVVIFMILRHEVNYWTTLGGSAT